MTYKKLCFGDILPSSLKSDAVFINVSCKLEVLGDKERERGMFLAGTLLLPLLEISFSRHLPKHRRSRKGGLKDIYISGDDNYGSVYDNDESDEEEPSSATPTPTTVAPPPGNGR